VAWPQADGYWRLVPLMDEAVYNAYGRRFVRRGGKARAKALTAKKRTAIRRKGAEARWSKTRAKKGNS